MSKYDLKNLNNSVIKYSLNRTYQNNNQHKLSLNNKNSNKEKKIQFKK